MVTSGRAWLKECSCCGYLNSTLSPQLRDSKARAAIDEDLRESALNTLRKQNFERILDRLELCRSQKRGSLLDVGCAHGWFLEAAQRRGYDVLGIEPDPAMHAAAADRGFAVVNGLFPDDVPAGKAFDVISFNDVLEHLPSADRALAFCRERLNPSGSLVINIPTSQGVFYRTGVVLDRLGLGDPLDRMWQKNFSSPHISYFRAEHLAILAQRCGLQEAHRSTLPSIGFADIWARLRYDRGSAVWASALVFVGIACIWPFLRLLPADINLQIFSLPPEPQATKGLLQRNFLAPGLSRTPRGRGRDQASLRAIRGFRYVYATQFP
jgi:SAM-dependent methyltransferase